MPLQIHIMRHGRSALEYPTNWITPAEFREWIGIYNRTGIADDSRPPENLTAALDEIRAVVCSDYPRSIESAARLFPGRPPIISALFREVGRPLPARSGIRLPLQIWDRLSILLWKLSLIASDESIRAACQRVQAATRDLVNLAQEFSCVLFVGHGMMNGLIGQALRRQGWHGPRHVNDEYWGITSFLSPSSC